MWVTKLALTPTESQQERCDGPPISRPCSKTEARGGGALSRLARSRWVCRKLVGATVDLRFDAEKDPRGTKKPLHGRRLQETVAARLVERGNIRRFSDKPDGASKFGWPMLSSTQLVQNGQPCRASKSAADHITHSAPTDPDVCSAFTWASQFRTTTISLSFRFSDTGLIIKKRSPSG